MLSEDEKEFVNVKIVDVQTNLTPTEILLHVEIQNNFREPIWIVNDDWFVWKKEEENIHISLAREKMRPGVEVFGYFNPNRKKVGPQETFYRKLKLIFPLRLNMIWNKEDKVHLSPGKYQFKATVGYGFEEKFDEIKSENIEQDILNWQKKSTSEYVTITVT